MTGSFAGHVAALLQRVASEGLVDDVAALEPRFAEADNQALRFEVAKLLGFFWLRRGDNARALHWSDAAADIRPGDEAAAYNAIYACLHLGRWDETVARCQAAIAAHGERSAFYDILAACHGVAGRPHQASEAGTRALTLKDAAATGTPWMLPPVPRFDGTDPARNVIAVSLFGANPKYTDGAILNARAAPFLYPGWTVRIYTDDSVPRPVLDALVQANAQVMTVGGMASEPFGPLWRFMVADDPGVDRYVLRDADSLINTRERVAVDEWIASDRHFHVMRDHYDHCELVLAGLWGGTRGALPPMLPAIQAWTAAQNQVLGRTTDQEFLRTSLWPTIRQSLLTHDSQFAFGPAAPFPTVGTLPPGCWVGCQWRQHARPPA